MAGWEVKRNGTYGTDGTRLPCHTQERGAGCPGAGAGATS